ncbi:MAG: DinB family protein [Chloroflexota bacterium]
MVMSHIYRLMGQLLMERPARDKSLAELIATLERGGAQAASRIAAARDGAQNRETLRHIIAIERWGQARLRTVLEGEVHETSSDAYRPEDGDWQTLKRRFAQTREETVAVARRLQDADVPPGETVRHDQWGDLSIRGWLRYLAFHAEKDVKTLRS